MPPLISQEEGLRLEGDSPRTPLDELGHRQEEANFWNPVLQLPHMKKRSAPRRPDEAPNA